MVDAVGPHLHHHKIVPVFAGEEMAGEMETFPRHLVNVGQDFFLVAGAEIADIENVFADDLLDLFFQLGRIGVFTCGVRSKEVRHHHAI